MNARETLQALVDGKTIREELLTGDYRLIRLNDNGDFETTARGNVDVYSAMPYITFENVEIWAPYTLDFTKAMEELLDGKSVQSESSKDIFYFYGGKLYVSCAGVDDEIRGITAEEVAGKWRLVE